MGCGDEVEGGWEGVRCVGMDGRWFRVRNFKRMKKSFAGKRWGGSSPLSPPGSYGPDL